MFLKEALDKLADFPIMNGSCQVIGQSRFAGIGVKDCRNKKFLSQGIFFRENAMFSENFQVFNLNFIHDVLLNSQNVPVILLLSFG